MNPIRFLALIVVCFCLDRTKPAQAAATAGTSSDPMTAGEFGFIEHLGTSPAFRTLIELHSADALIGSDGAIGRNKKSFLDVAEQRGGGWYVMRGIIDSSPDAISKSIQAMAYGFAHQNADGYFENALGASPTRAVEADAFFLQAFGRIALVVRNSPYQQQFEPQLRAFGPKLSLAMNWLTQNAEELHRQDNNAVNRLWFDAMAFTLNGILLNNSRLIALGHKFEEVGAKGQREDGSFNEHGGADTSYQAISMQNIAVLLSYETDPQIAGKLKDCLRRAAEWELPRIDKNGDIDSRGNSRTGLGQETYFGKPKEINYEEVALALFYTSDALGMPELRAAAETVAGTALKQKR